MQARKWYLAISFAVLALSLSACGGEGSDGNGNNSNTSGSNGSGSTSTTPSNGAGSTASALTATQYALYKEVTQAQLGGSAGQVSSPTANGGTLQLDSGNTLLAITDAKSGAMSASGYYITNRSNGAVIMLCDPLTSGGTVGANTESRYVGVAISSSDGNQGTPINNVASLAGKTLYYVADCSFQSKAINLAKQNHAEGQDHAPDANTASMTFDANGNASFNNGNENLTASDGNSILSGAAISFKTGNVYWNAYQLGSGSTARYVIVDRGISNGIAQSYIGMWITN